MRARNDLAYLRTRAAVKGEGTQKGCRDDRYHQTSFALLLLLKNNNLNLNGPETDRQHFAIMVTSRFQTLV